MQYGWKFEIPSLRIFSRCVYSWISSLPRLNISINRSPINGRCRRRELAKAGGSVSEGSKTSGIEIARGRTYISSRGAAKTRRGHCARATSAQQALFTYESWLINRLSLTYLPASTGPVIAPRFLTARGDYLARILTRVSISRERVTRTTRTTA